MLPPGHTASTATALAAEKESGESISYKRTDEELL
ncbi:uncharacterized protein G2W53_028355 [Senna tora]|uniref:Uncharacterized protein n=1 Tax=Senna tora TaxID=362788 RepID=A0A834WCS7_9FABA|nr:uncharacterized protein G2W53_028355 [Senna tora]